MSDQQHPPEVTGLAIPASDVATLLGISERHVWSLLAKGHLPRPVRLGKAVRWSLEEIRAWLDAGAPEWGDWECRKRP